LGKKSMKKKRAAAEGGRHNLDCGVTGRDKVDKCCAR